MYARKLIHTYLNGVIQAKLRLHLLNKNAPAKTHTTCIVSHIHTRLLFTWHCIIQSYLPQYNSDKPDTREDHSDNTRLNFLWIVNFPLFTLNTDTGQCMRLWNDIIFVDNYDSFYSLVESSHHPFTAPVLEDEHLLHTGNNMDLEKVHLSMFCDQLVGD
jgi:aspartyl-tRNA synthetase